MSATAYDAVWAAMTPPNVLVPLPDTDYDIFVFFYDGSQNRTTTDHVDVMNDWNADPIAAAGGK